MKTTQGARVCVCHYMVTIKLKKYVKLLNYLGNIGQHRSCRKQVKDEWHVVTSCKIIGLSCGGLKLRTRLCEASNAFKRWRG